jgi:hypothetical protein
MIHLLKFIAISATTRLHEVLRGARLRMLDAWSAGRSMPVVAISATSDATLRH